MTTTLTAALCCALEAAEADPAPIGGDYGEPSLLVAAPDAPAIRHLSWPKIVAAGDGTLVLAYSAGIGHNVGGSGPPVSRLTDGGATFSAPNLLAYFPDDDERYRDCGNMALGLADDGAVMVLAICSRPTTWSRAARSTTPWPWAATTSTSTGRPARGSSRGMCGRTPSRFAA